MNRKKLILSLVGAAAVAVAGGIGALACRAHPAPWSEEDIFEIAAREYIGRGEPGSTVFLEVGDKSYRDPSPSFLARFGDLGVTIKPASQAAYEGAEYAVVDSKTGKGSYILSVGHVRQVSPKELEVRLEAYAGFEEEWGGLYRLRRESGAWKVVEKRELWGE